MAIRRSPMEDQTLRCWRTITDHDRRDVPTLASNVADRGMVSQHGIPRTHWIILRHGNLPPDTLLRDCLHGAPRFMAVPESVRGRGLLR